MNSNRCPKHVNSVRPTSHEHMQNINITWCAKPMNCCWHHCLPPSRVAAMHVHQITLAALPVRLPLPTHGSEHRTDSSKKKASPRPRVPSSSSQCFSGASENSKGGQPDRDRQMKTQCNTYCPGAQLYGCGIAAPSNMTPHNRTPQSRVRLTSAGGGGCCA